MIFDTHSHIYDPAFDDVEAIINNARNNGVTKILIPGDTVSNSIKGLNIALTHEGVYCAVGVHPEEVETNNFETYLDELRSLVNKYPHKIKALGEIGLDYHFSNEEAVKAKQKQLFIEQIDLANELKLPIIVHSRDACNDTLEILKVHKPLFGCVYHCFSYAKEVMEELIKLGFYIGLDGPVTFKNARTPKEVATLVPLDRLLVETDAPYLTPTPHRGERNEPAYVTLVVDEIARLKNMTYDGVADATYHNALRFFKIDE